MSGSLALVGVGIIILLMLYIGACGLIGHLVGKRRKTAR